VLFKKKKFERKVLLKKEVLDSILSFCKMKHPNEGILILKGKSKNGFRLLVKLDLLLQDFRIRSYLLI
jgi:hypothetical protein